MSVVEMQPKKRARKGRLGPHSRPKMLARLDHRTREAKLLDATRAELTQHLSGRPSAVERALVERAARLTIYLEAMDRESLESGVLSERNSRQYLAWSNSLRLTLAQLGLKAAAVDKPPSLDDIVRAPP
jgi:hypothetical protein